MELKNASPLGKGSWHPAGSVTDADLMTALLSYRKRIAGVYRSVKPGEITTGVLGAPFHVSPKVDGELWFLVLVQGQATLVSVNASTASFVRVVSLPSLHVPAAAAVAQAAA